MVRSITYHFLLQILSIHSQNRLINLQFSESKNGYSHEDPIKFLTKSIESSLCDYSEARILVTGNITVTRTIAGDPNADSAVEKK